MAAKTTRNLIKAPRKKAAPIVRRPKTGLPAVPMETFDACKQYFHEEIDKKVVAELIKAWVKKNYSKDDAKAILANPEYNFHMYSHFGAAVHWMNSAKEFDEKYKRFPEALKEFFEPLIRSGKAILNSEVPLVQETEDGAPVTPTTVVKLTPAQLLARKIQSTIMVDIDGLEDAWIEKRTIKLDLYNKFQQHQLKGAAVQPVRERLERWLNEYEDAYHRRCEQAVEGYSHIERPELKRRIDAIKTMLEDLGKVKAASAATRTIRTPKTRAADKQVARLQYLKSSDEYKLMSVNPVQLPGSMRLYAFNEKTRTLTEYISNSTKGFEVKGTSLNNFDVETSRSVRLRKPNEFLAVVLSKTAKQIDNEWNKLTTKSSTPNGRINKDTVLLRVMDQ